MNFTLALLLIFFVVYVFLATEWRHRTAVAMLGASTAIIVARLFYGHTENFWNMVDFDTIGLLMGMMVIVGVLSHSGFFEYLGVKVAVKSGGSPRRFFFGVFFLTAFTSAFLDNVTTVLIMTPLVIYVAKAMETDPMPFLIGEVIASNIGGTATLIGDPPNIMIGTGADLSFLSFMVYQAPVIVVETIVAAFLVYFMYRRSLDKPPKKLLIRDVQIKSSVMIGALIVLGLTIFLFFIGGFIGIPETVAALLGASLAMLLVEHEHVEKVVRDVEWTTILFFVALFIIVGYLEKTGLLDWVAHKLVDVSGGGFALIMVILWGSAVFSAFVDNIPFTATMIPIVASLVAMDPALDHHHAIWWALSMGACLGGNATVIGASANVVVSGIARRNRLPMTFFNFAKVAAPTTAAVLLISSAYLYLLWVL